MSISYHLSELHIALDPTHPDHILPPPLPQSAKVLDVGCGAGQTLIAAYPDSICYGLDIDAEALGFGRTLTDSVRFVNGRAEAMPFREGEFDLVLGRVSVPYTNVGQCLKEMRRVVRDGGDLWLVLHPFSKACQQARLSGWKGKVHFLYVLLNSICFHWCGRQFPFVRGKYESFQTERGIRRALAENGFVDITITRTRHFLVTARAGELVVKTGHEEEALAYTPSCVI